MRHFIHVAAVLLVGLWATDGSATPYTENVPAPTSLPLPPEYPAAGGVVTVLTGVNGNVYYQFSDPTGAFRGFNSNGQPTRFRGNPFTVNDPIALNCGFTSCTDYFGGAIARMDVRFSAYDGDTQPGGFDENDINLLINGTDIGSWSGITTERTNTDGTQSFGTTTGFGNNTFNTAWFSSTNTALLNNILTTGQTVSQVLDADPNDNYWDFRRGPTLANGAIETVAPGYELDKTVRGGATTFTQVGEMITYDYVVRNIGSVDISNVEVTDDKIGAVTNCSPTTLPRTTSSSQPPNEATCSAIYTVTQADVDAQVLTNIAQVTGDPEFGTLGPLSESVTMTGPAYNSVMELDKVASPTSFTAAGETITYTFTLSNTGNTTLSTVSVSDPRIPSLSCSAASLTPPVPPAAAGPANQLVCVGTYVVTQADVDAFILNGTTLDNTATATATDPANTAIMDSDTETLNGPAAAPALSITKTPTPTTYSAEGQTIFYSFVITNDGNVSWPDAPAIVDPLTSNEACPTGPVAPGGMVTCSASYDITLDDMDAETVPNTVTASITVGGVLATNSANASVTADVETSLLIQKTLLSGANPITSETDELVYEYELTNDGNTRISTFDVQDDKVNVTCPVVTLDPGQSVTCTSDPYDVTQQDIDDGGVTNEATATAQTPQGATVTSATVDLTVPAAQSPALSMSKASDPDPVPAAAFFPNATVDYVYTVTNTGNVTITDPVTITDDKIVGAIACPAGPIAPMGMVECRATYTVTPADVADGIVVNSATASDGNVTSNSDSVAIPQDGAAGITLDKVANTANFDDTTDTIEYTFTVTNSGETTIVDLTPIAINDPLLGAAFTCTEQPATLSPGQFYSCTRTYGPVTQADIDAGEVMNSATASYTAGGVTITSPSSEATVLANVVPALTLAKTALAADGGAQFDTLGEEIIYTFAVTNDSTQTLASVTVTDPLIPALSCTLTNIAPMTTDSTCTGSYFVTQDDLDTGSILNEAEAVGTSPTGQSTSDTDTNTMTINPAAQTSILALDKTSNATTFSAVGDTIIYAIEVTNAGNLTLDNVVVNDPALGLSCNIGTLAPLASDDSCAGTHVIVQADLDAGEYFNEATASATGAANVTSDITANGPVRNPDFEVAKTASADTEVTEGTVITYSHVVTNTGNVTLTNVTLTDTHTGASGTQSLTFSPSNVITSLAPGAIVTLTTSYTITQDDIDVGTDVTNTVNATATPPAGTTPPTATDNEVVDLQDQAPAVSVVKTETDGTGTFGDLPTTEDFTFEVTNDGNVTLVGFTLNDPIAGFSCALADIPPNTSVTTCGNGSALSVTYAVDQDDIDRGSLTNTVTVTDGTTTGTDAVSLAGPDQLPLLDMVKTSTGGGNFDDIGDVITYDYVVTNTGNITMTSAITVADDKTTVTCPALPAGGLLVGNSITCTASYAVTQADLDLGTVTNEATATIQQPVIPSVTHPTGTATVSSGLETEMVGALQDPSIAISKAIAPGTASTYAALSDSVTFQFTVTNTGNVTLTEAVTVTDINIPDVLACPASGAVNILPGGTVVCTTTWSPDQGDLDAGSFVNSATAQTMHDGNTIVTPTPASATATAIQTPAMEMVKALTGLEEPGGAPTSVFASGNVAVYSYTITNTGNTTLTGPIGINDNLIGAVSCPAGDLAPTDPPLVCSAQYVITDDDVELGSVTNIATATDANGNQTPPADETIPGGSDPSIAVIKTANVSTFAAVNDPIVYTYTVTNTSPGSMIGGVLVRPALENPITISDDKFSGPISCLPTADNRLSPDEMTTCTATYLVTQADLDAVQSDGAGGLQSAFVTNNAVAETTFGSAAVTSPAATVTVFGNAAPALSVAKDVTTGNDPAALNDMLEYTITTSNSGNQRLTGVTVGDPLLPTLACTIDTISTPAPFTLEAGQDVVCTGTYTVTQDDIDAQVLTNTATAEGTSPDGTVVDNTGTDIHPLETDAGAVTVLKELTTGTPAAAFTDIGQPVSFTVTVTNSGNVTLSTIDVTDNRVPGTCTVGPLAPGEFDDVTCVFEYFIQQEDIDAGELTNIATGVATPVSPGATPVMDSDDITVQGPDFEPSLSVTKSADTMSFAMDGVNITYTYVIANTGNVTIVDQPTLTDDKIPAIALSCDAIPLGGLPPLESIECSAIYQVTQQDVDDGGVTNIASATAPDTYNGGAPIEGTDTLTVPSVRTAGMTVLKVASDTTDVAAGDIITYTYTVENTGNVTLEPVNLVDNHTSAAGTNALTIQNGGVIASLAPDAIVILTATYEVTQTDIDTGTSLTNTVTATPTPPAGVTLAPVTADEDVTVAAAAPLLEVLKTVSVAPDPIVPGSTVTFQITVENTGNVSLTGVTLADTLRRADTTLITPAPVPAFVSGDGGVANTLEVDEVWIYTVSHTITQDDIDAGGLSNSATASGTDPFGTDVDDTSDNGTGAGSMPTAFPIAFDPAVEGLKTITSTTIAVDETVVFEITIENTGNVTLSNVAVATDTLTRADGTALTLTTAPVFVSATGSSPAGTLLVDEIATYRATYVLTQDDIDAGGIRNTATVSGEDPSGGTATDITDNGAGGGDDETVLVIAADPEMSLVKSLASGGPTYDTVGQELVFSFAVTNDGNVTLTDPISIVDVMITDPGEVITCDPVPLAPMDTLTCTGSYFIAQDDLNAGSITNSAVAQDGTTPPSDPSVVTVNAQQNPELSMTKVADTIASADFIVGAMASYTYTVTNEGNVTITDAVTINDNRIDSGDITCPTFPSAGIAPMGTYICTATYEVTADDVSLGSVTNNASATDGTVTSPLVSETIPAGGVPALTTDKALISVNGDTAATSFSAIGDILTYEFTVTNTGDVSFANDITVVDAIINESPITCFTTTPANPDVIPTESVTCQGTYTVDQDDLDAGEVFNEATAQTTHGAGPTIVTSPAGTETTPATTDPMIELVKSVATLPVTAVDQVLTYTLTITNRGNQTLSDISGTDPLLPGLVCEATTLAPGGVLVCSDTYMVTQDDIDGPTLINEARVTALTPQGAQVEDDDRLETDMPAANPLFELAKSANPDPFGGLGTNILYTFAATNTGTVTLFNVTITDAIVDPAYSCVIARLDVGDTDTTCTLSYAVTQDDVDAGELTNTANATAVDPFGTTVIDDDTITTDGPAAAPALETVKTASVAGTSVGSIVTYTLQVENTGNVTLTPPVIVDTMTRANGSATALSTPFVYASGDTDGDGFVDVTEIWVYTATYELGQADLNAGGVSNTATASAEGPDGTPASDVSDNGDDSDGNLVDDPTVVEILPGPAINTEKTVVSGVGALNEVVTYQISATNVGNVTLTVPTITDAITRADGGVAAGTTTGPTLTSGNAAGIDPGEAWVWSFTYQITQDDIDAGGLINTATAGGTGPTGTVVDDVSDNGNDTDGNTEDDDTLFAIVAMPQLTVTKEVVRTGAAVGEEMEFTVTVNNTGNVTLTDLQIADTMTNADGTVVTPDSITVASGSAAQLLVGNMMTYTVLYTLTQADIDSGGVTNSAAVTGTTPAGGTTTDVSDTGSGGGSTPTPAPIPQIDSMVATKTASTPTRIAPDVFQVTFTMTLENLGNVTQTDLVLEDDLTVFVAPATLSSVTTPVVTGFTSATANPAYNGVGVTTLTLPGATLAPMTTGTIEITVVYDVSAGQPAGTNVLEATSDRITTAVLASSGPVTPGAPPDILATKTVTPDRAMVGETVTYTLAFTNNLATDEANLTLVDAMPAGLSYVTGSATYNGAATPQPDINGRTLSWSGVTIPAGDTVTITVQARVVDGGLGDIVNEAYVLDPSGARVSNVAAATLRLPVEAVFDCTDIIGKVFDDRNMNGYQDGVIEDRGISDQTYDGGKFGVSPVMAPDGEPGLPNVRLVTVDGTIITTDDYGRFSVPCGALPNETGANFTLKLDTRSLPSGYQLTTENPRVIRVTAGTMARLNFGTTIATVVDIDLMDSAFAAGSADVTPALFQGVDQLVAVLREDPSVLRLSYYRADESIELARARLDRLEALIRDRWQGSGAGHLPIERTINRLQ